MTTDQSLVILFISFWKVQYSDLSTNSDTESLENNVRFNLVICFYIVNVLLLGAKYVHIGQEIPHS